MRVAKRNKANRVHVMDTRRRTRRAAQFPLRYQMRRSRRAARPRPHLPPCELNREREQGGGYTMLHSPLSKKALILRI